MEEIWKDIEGYEGLYQVSNYSRIISLKTNTILKGRKGSRAYLEVGLYKNKIMKQFKIHRLVAEAFIDKEYFKYVDKEDKLKYINNLDKLVVNHKDENKSNNDINNLEWCTPKYNCNYGTRNEKIGQVSKNKLNRNGSRVYQYDLDMNLIKIWPSIMECKRNGYSYGGIYGCCNHRQNTSCGYIWSYKKI